ncbi:hypothetical protein LZC95_52430 [Pendulispora brunnea]|uniref:Uncharacterized protein n=1 Tax=Pendulispora brunnea TaxID=2905690 RepID=A0ABZ2KC53_9BACT
MSKEQLPFERPIDVYRRRNFLVTGLALALLLGGALLLVIAIGWHFTPGILGIMGVTLGLGLLLSNKRRAMWAMRHHVHVRADAAGIWEEGRLVVPRQKIAHGYFQPRRTLSSVCLYDRWRNLVFEAVLEQPLAAEMLRALTLDAASRRASYHTVSPAHATPLRTVAIVLAMIAGAMGLGTLSSACGVNGPFSAMFGIVFGIALGLILAYVPLSVTVGIDGVDLRWFLWRRFIPMSRIVRAEPDAFDVRLWLEGGESELIHVGISENEASPERRDAIVARILEVFAARRGASAQHDIAGMLAKRARSHAAWFEALAALRASKGGYRDTVVCAEDLWATLEDPSAAEDVRGAAGFLLRPSLDTEGKARVRIAAEATASPALRTALEAVAGEEEDQAVTSMLEDLATQSPDQPR